MKKIIALLLACMMVIGLFAACGGSKAPAADAPAADAPAADAPAADAPAADAPAAPEKLTLKVWCPGDELECTRKMIENFAAAHPEYDCSGIECVDVGIDEAETNLLNDADLAADVLQLPSGGITTMVEAGLLLPITVDAENIKSLYGEGALDAVIRHDDELNMDLMYGVPFSPNTWFMYYNRDMYTEEEVKSLETMLAKDLGEDVYNFSCQIGNSWYIEAFFYAAGCNVFGPDGNDATQCDWNSANGLAAANYIYDLTKNPKYLEDSGDGISGTMMKDGKLGALCSGNWSYPDLYAAMGDKLGACALPTININGTDCQLSNFADYKTYCVKSNTAHPLAAQQLAAWLCNEESQLIRYQMAGAAPTATALMENEEVASNCSIVGLLAQSAYATPQPSIPKIQDYWKPAEAIGDGIIGGTITPDNLQAELDKAVEQIVGDVIG